MSEGAGQSCNVSWLRAHSSLLQINRLRPYAEGTSRFDSSDDREKLNLMFKGSGSAVAYFCTFPVGKITFAASLNRTVWGRSRPSQLSVRD